MKIPLIILSAVIAILLGVGLSLQIHQSKPVQLQSLTWFGDQARALPEFELLSTAQKSFSPETLKGKWHLLFFGYTHCPDICPDTLQVLNQAMEKMTVQESAQPVQIVFVSVDPQRDNLDAIKQYVQYFNPDFIGATGNIEQIEQLTKSVGILHYRESSGEQYDVAHSGSLVLIDPEARYTGVFGAPHDAEKIAHDLSALLQG